MTVTVKYGRTHSYTQMANGEPFRPYVPVRLQYGGRSHDTLGLIDSGADTSMFHTQFAPALGIDLSKGQPGTSQGIGGSANVVYFDIFLTVFGKRFPARVAFINDNRFKSFGLLGRHDFFMSFRVGFDQPATQVFLHQQ